MSARSRLSREEIHGILRALRNLDRKKRFDGDVVATAGEILGEDEEKAFERDSATDDTRVRTAVAWLEEAELLKREENFVQVFPSSLRVDSAEEARKRLARAAITDAYRGQLQRIAETLIEAGADEGVTTDELMGVSGLGSEGGGARKFLNGSSRCRVSVQRSTISSKRIRRPGDAPRGRETIRCCRSPQIWSEARIGCAQANPRLCA